MKEEITQNNDTNFSSELESNIGFSEEEKLEIQAEINNIVQSSKIAITQDRLRPNAAHSGLRFPFIVNGIILGIAAAIIIIFALIFSRQQQQRIAEAQQFTSTESQLIKELVRQSKQQLAEREAQIDSIQGELGQISEALADLEENITSQIESRRSDLQAEFERQFDERRRQLETENYSPAELEQLLDELQQQSQERINTELALFQEQLEVENAAREAELNSLRSNLEGEISEKQGQISQLQASLEQSEDELLTAVESGEQTIVELQTQLASASGLENEYQALLEQQDSITTFTAQVDGAFQTFFELLSRGSLDGSLEELNKVEALVRGIATEAYDRADLDLKTIQTFREYIDLKQEDSTRLDTVVSDAPFTSSIATAERFVALQEGYQSALNRTQRILDPNQAKQILLSIFNEYQEEFPNFARIVSQYDGAIISALEERNKENLSNALSQSARQAGDQGRREGINDAYTLIRAALGDEEFENRAQNLRRTNQTFSTIHNLIQSTFNERIEAERAQVEEGLASQSPVGRVSQVELPFIGYVNGTIGKKEFTFSNSAGIAVRLGMQVEVYRDIGGTFIAIGKAVISRTDNNIIQAVIQSTPVGQIQREDGVFLSR